MLVSLSPSRPCPAAWEHLPEFPTWQPPKNKNNDCFSLAIIMLSSSSEIHFVFFIESKACCFLQKKSYCVFIQFLKQLICSISKGRNILVKRASPRISLFISRKKIINIHILFFKPTLIIWYMHGSTYFTVYWVLGDSCGVIVQPHTLPFIHSLI